MVQNRFASYSRRPVGKFFAVIAVLVTILAIVLIRKGGAALHEAGTLDVTPTSLPRIDLLGIYPSRQTMLAQLAVLLIVVTSFLVNMRSLKEVKA